MDGDLRTLAEQYLGTPITDREWLKALPQSAVKLGYVIAREGDADGERKKPYYLARLIEEAVRADRLERYLYGMRNEGERLTQFAEQPISVAASL